LSSTVVLTPKRKLINSRKSSTNYAISIDQGAVVSAKELADDANTIAKTKAKTFAQDAIPTSLTIGDLWLDTNDKNKLYRAASVGADQIAVGEWELVRDSDIAQALSNAATAITNAATAQSTADGKVTTFFSAAVPTSEAEGDLWIDLDDGNKLYRAASSGADEIKAGEWVEIQDDDIATAVSNAADAQSTADLKIVTFYASDTPTSTDIGDLWINSGDSNKLYRAACIGANEITAGEWELVRDDGIATALTVYDSGVFGDGSDGDVTISENTNLSRDMYYDDLTIDSGKILFTKGYRIFVKNTLLNNGTIDHNGGNGGDGGNGSSSEAGAAGERDTEVDGSIAGYYNGSFGYIGKYSSEGLGQNGTAGDDGNGINGLGGNGGAAGSGGNAQISSSTIYTGGSGGTGATVTSTSATIGFRHYPSIITMKVGTSTWFDTFVRGGGAGGGGGQGAISVPSSVAAGGGAGAGACGGGVIVISAYVISNIGTIRANGGNGGNGGTAYVTSGQDCAVGGAGAGGGGGGGVIVLFYNELTAGTITVNGGTGGTGGAGLVENHTYTNSATNGGNGTSGSAGTIIYISTKHS
jgi:hypothetical protein